MRAALITGALARPWQNCPTGRKNKKTKTKTVRMMAAVPQMLPADAGNWFWVARLADLILVLHSTAVERVYVFTNGFFHRAITRKRNNVSNKDFIPATLIYLNTGGEDAGSNSFILPAYTACTRPTNANTGGAGGRGGLCGGFPHHLTQ